MEKKSIQVLHGILLDEKKALFNHGLRRENFEALKSGKGSFAAFLRLLDAVGIDFDEMVLDALKKKMKNNL
jgi:hypothetical protein